MHVISQVVSRQLRKPSGILGTALTGPVMAAMNQAMIEWTVNLLRVRLDDRILDIGCGPGTSVKMFAERAVNGTVIGLDYSRTMVRAAASMKYDAGMQNRIRVHQGDATHLPYADQAFDIVCGINVVYFWPDPVATLREIARVLKPHGRVALSIRPRAFMEGTGVTRDGFTLYDAADLTPLLEAAGFTSVAVHDHPHSRLPASCLIGTTL